MSIERANTYLEAFSALNDGPDHGTDYSLARLTDADSLENALRAFFGSYHTSRILPQDPDHWHIRLDGIAGDWAERVKSALRRWFFQEQYSPKIAQEFAAENCINACVGHLKSAVGECRAYEVFVSPPPNMWYECVWQDFAFTNKSSHWLLHFGFSD